MIGDFLAAHATEIWSALGGVLAGSLITLKVTRQNKVSGHGSVLDQSGSKVGGDQVGGDKIDR